MSNMLETAEFPDPTQWPTTEEEQMLPSVPCLCQDRASTPVFLRGHNSTQRTQPQQITVTFIWQLCRPFFRAILQVSSLYVHSLRRLWSSFYRENLLGDGEEKEDYSQSPVSNAGHPERVVLQRFWAFYIYGPFPGKHQTSLLTISDLAQVYDKKKDGGRNAARKNKRKSTTSISSSTMHLQREAGRGSTGSCIRKLVWLTAMVLQCERKACFLSILGYKSWWC